MSNAIHPATYRGGGFLAHGVLNIWLFFYNHLNHRSNIASNFSFYIIDLVIEMAMFFGVSLNYILLGRELQTDDLKKQIRMMLAQLMELEQKL